MKAWKKAAQPSAHAKQKSVRLWFRKLARIGRRAPDTSPQRFASDRWVARSSIRVMEGEVGDE
jgi:hypothetical protein